MLRFVHQKTDVDLGLFVGTIGRLGFRCIVCRLQSKLRDAGQVPAGSVGSFATLRVANSLGILLRSEDVFEVNIRICRCRERRVCGRSC